MHAFVATTAGGPPIAAKAVAEGEPAEVILATIQGEAADLVVVGSMHHNEAWPTIILGSTSEAVLNHAALLGTGRAARTRPAEQSRFVGPDGCRRERVATRLGEVA